MSWDRLTFRALLLISMTFISGCAAKKEANEEPGAEAGPLAQGERAIKRDAWAGQQFTLEDSSEVQVSAALTSGPAIDLYVLAEAAFNKWNTVVSKGQAVSDLSFETIPDLKIEGLSSSFTSPWTVLPGGTYYLVLDNTSYGGTAPPTSRSDDIATVDFKVDARALEE